MEHQDLINRLTLEEKCALLSGDTAFTTRAYPHHGIPAMQFSDGPHGLRLQAAGANHLGIGGSVPATCFPTAATVANSWDPSLGERLGTALGEEALAEKVDVVLGPGLNIKRSPLCGRNFEYFSEDPLVAGDMAAGYVRGIQSQGVSACPKHFAVNSQETRRQGSDSQVDERTLRELYLAGFERVVKNARPKCLMSSYNMVNGTYANENQHLLREVLRDEWGYDGAVVTDWQGSVDHVAGVKAGSDFEMPAHGMPAVRELVGAVREGRISEAEVDAQVDEALELILTTTAATRAAGNSFDRLAHHQIAHDIAAQSIVMLKNEDHILPLAPATRVALVGDFADNPRYQGAGSSLVNCTKLEKLTGVIADTELEYVGYEPAFNRDGGSTEAMAQAAADLARRADVVLMCLGLDESRESEGAERLDMSMDPAQVHALELVAEANPNVVVLLSAGSAVECDWVANAKAVLYLALGGQAGASAALDVVTGAVNPSGKLTETWARRLADTPTAGRFPADGRIAEYREGLFVGYRYYQTAGVDVAFPFGFGLSYTTFEYGPLQAEVVKDAGSDVSVRCSVAIANTGERAGAEVVQLYVAKPDGEVFRPAQELRAYEKVRLEPGETTTVTFDLGSRAFVLQHRHRRLGDRARRLRAARGRQLRGRALGRHRDAGRHRRREPLCGPGPRLLSLGQRAGRARRPVGRHPRAPGAQGGPQDRRQPLLPRPQPRAQPHLLARVARADADREVVHQEGAPEPQRPVHLQHAASRARQGRRRLGGPEDGRRPGARAPRLLGHRPRALPRALRTERARQQRDGPEAPGRSHAGRSERRAHPERRRARVTLPFHATTIEIAA